MFNYRKDERSMAELIEIECSDLAELLIEKNEAYGAEVFKAPPLVPELSGKTGTLIRIGDKFSRLANLLRMKKDGVVKTSESIDDTVLDLAGYCVLYLVQSKREAQQCTQTDECSQFL